MLPAGTYHGTVTGGITSQAKTGSLQMVVEISVTHRAEDGQWIEMSPAVRRIYMSLSEAAWPYAHAKLVTLGFNGDFADPSFSEAATTKGVELVCSSDRFNDKLTEQWELAHWGESAIERAPDAKIHELNSRWRADSAVDKPGSPASSPPPNSPAASTPPPATSTPPPAASTTPPSKSADLPQQKARASTREEAWTALGMAWGSTKTREELAELWRELVAERKKQEDQFTAADWQSVADAAQIPF